MRGQVLFNGNELAVGTPRRADKARFRVIDQDRLVGSEIHDLHIEIVVSILLVGPDGKVSVRGHVLVCFSAGSCVIFGGKQRDGCQQEREGSGCFHHGKN